MTFVSIPDEWLNAHCSFHASASHIQYQTNSEKYDFCLQLWSFSLNQKCPIAMEYILIKFIWPRFWFIINSSFSKWSKRKTESNKKNGFRLLCSETKEQINKKRYSNTRLWKKNKYGKCECILDIKIPFRSLEPNIFYLHFYLYSKAASKDYKME